MKKYVGKILITLGVLLVFWGLGYLGCIEFKDWSYVTDYKNLWDLIILSIVITMVPLTGWLCSRKKIVQNYISVIILIIFLISMALTMSSRYIGRVEGLVVCAILVGPASILNYFATRSCSNSKEKPNRK